MGGYSQYAKSQQQTSLGKIGDMSYKPLEPFKVPSAGEEQVAEGIGSAAKSISGSLLGAMQANYMNDQKMKLFQQIYGGYGGMKPDVNMGGD